MKKIELRHGFVLLFFLIFSLVLWNSSSSPTSWMTSELVLALMIASMWFLTKDKHSEILRISVTLLITLAGFALIAILQQWDLTEAFRPLFGGLILYLILEILVTLLHKLPANREGI